MKGKEIYFRCIDDTDCNEQIFCNPKCVSNTQFICKKLNDSADKVCHRMSKK